MKTWRIGTIALLVIGLSGAPAFAGDLSKSVAAAAAAAARAETQESPLRPAPTSRKALIWGGTALFAGGMTYGLFEFINNKNGSYSEFGEATATNKKGGAAGLGLAFAGGTMMLLGKRASAAPSVSFGAKRIGVSKRVTW
jgi:hypothetical protein